MRAELVQLTEKRKERLRPSTVPNRSGVGPEHWPSQTNSHLIVQVARRRRAWNRREQSSLLDSRSALTREGHPAQASDAQPRTVIWPPERLSPRPLAGPP